MWQAERDGIPNWAQIEEGCRPLSVQPSATAFAVGTALRYFVSENRTGSADERMKITGTKIPGTLEPYSSRMPGLQILWKNTNYIKGISNDLMTNCASLSNMNQYSE